MNPGCSLVDLLLFTFNLGKTRETKLCDHPPSIIHLVEPVNAGLRHRLKKTLAQSDCHWCLNEMKVGAKRKKQDEQADIRIFFQTVSK